MEEKIKQRLIGVLVLIGSLFIILPFLFHNSRPSAEQKTASTVSGGTTPPAVSVTLPAENTTTPNNNAVVQNTTPATTVTTTPNAGTAVAVTSAPAVAPTQPVQAAQQPIQPAPQTQKLQTTAQATTTKIEPATTVSADSGKLNSNTIASRPDASGFKPDESVSPTSGLTTGVPISTPSTTEAVSSSSASTMQPTAAKAQTQSTTTESAPNHTVAHHEQMVKTTYHPHHKIHAMNGKKWEIQLAVFSNERNAKQLMAKLHAHHYAAHTRRITHEGRHMIAVFVGPEFNHHKMMALQNHLRHEFHLGGVVKQV